MEILTTKEVPLSVTQAEQIAKIRDLANVRAVAATSKNDRLNIMTLKNLVVEEILIFTDWGIVCLR